MGTGNWYKIEVDTANEIGVPNLKSVSVVIPITGAEAGGGGYMGGVKEDGYVGRRWCMEEVGSGCRGGGFDGWKRKLVEEKKG